MMKRRSQSVEVNTNIGTQHLSIKNARWSDEANITSSSRQTRQRGQQSQSERQEGQPAALSTALVSPPRPSGRLKRAPGRSLHPVSALRLGRNCQQYVCPKCRKVYVSSLGLQRHREFAPKCRDNVTGTPNKPSTFAIEAVAEKESRSIDKQKSEEKENARVQQSPVKMLECDMCTRSFSQQLYLELHKCVHSLHQASHYQCTQCDHKFLTKVKLDHHFINSHYQQSTQRATNKTNNSICPYCSQIVGSCIDLILHKLECTLKPKSDNTTFVCGLACGQKFSAARFLQNHMLTCAGPIKPNLVALHTKTMLNPSTDSADSNNCSSVKDQTSCEKQTRSALALPPPAVHSWTCDVIDCRKKYSKIQVFKNHLFTHTEYPFNCHAADCQLSFAGKQAYVSHYQVEHGGLPRIAVCSECLEEFSSQQQLSAHVERVHDDEDLEADTRKTRVLKGETEVEDGDEKDVSDNWLTYEVEENVQWLTGNINIRGECHLSPHRTENISNVESICETSKDASQHPQCSGGKDEQRRVHPEQSEESNEDKSLDYNSDNETKKNIIDSSPLTIGEGEGVCTDARSQLPHGDSNVTCGTDHKCSRLLDDIEVDGQEGSEKEVEIFNSRIPTDPTRVNSAHPESDVNDNPTAVSSDDFVVELLKDDAAKRATNDDSLIKTLESSGAQMITIVDCCEKKTEQAMTTPADYIIVNTIYTQKSTDSQSPTYSRRLSEDTTRNTQLVNPTNTSPAGSMVSPSKIAGSQLIHLPCYLQVVNGEMCPQLGDFTNVLGITAQHLLDLNVPNQLKTEESSLVKGLAIDLLELSSSNNFPNTVLSRYVYEILPVHLRPPPTCFSEGGTSKLLSAIIKIRIQASRFRARYTQFPKYLNKFLVEKFHPFL